VWLEPTFLMNTFNALLNIVLQIVGWIAFVIGTLSYRRTCCS